MYPLMKLFSTEEVKHNILNSILSHIFQESDKNLMQMNNSESCVPTHQCMKLKNDHISFKDGKDAR